MNLFLAGVGLYSMIMCWYVASLNFHSNTSIIGFAMILLGLLNVSVVIQTYLLLKKKPIDVRSDPAESIPLVRPDPKLNKQKKGSSPRKPGKRSGTRYE